MKRSHFSIAGAAVSWFAIIAQFWLMLQNRTTGMPEMIIRFFSYFTILSNIIVALCYTACIFQTKSIFKKAGVLTAITVYIIVVGLIYQVLLRHLWQPTGLQWLADELLHSLIPILFIVYWLLYEKKKELKWRMLLPWLVYPLLYAIFILWRGGISGFYPYPFINVSKLGWQKTLVHIAGLFLLFVVVASLLIAIGKVLHKTVQKRS
jgi:hypothetical protein